MVVRGTLVMAIMFALAALLFVIIKTSRTPLSSSSSPAAACHKVQDESTHNHHVGHADVLVDGVSFVSEWVTTRRTGLGGVRIDDNAQCKVPSRSTELREPPHDYFNQEQKACERARFSTLYDGYIVGRCSGGAKLEYVVLDWADTATPNTSSQWKTVNPAVRVSHGRVHVRCRGSVMRHWYPAPVPPAVIREHRQRQHAVLGERSMLPNVYVFIIDSMSRAQFLSNLPRTVEHLEALSREQSSPAHVFEFFRSSSVGWGTPTNINALWRGCSNVAGGGANEKHLGCAAMGPERMIELGEHYAATGYHVLGAPLKRRPVPYVYKEQGFVGMTPEQYVDLKGRRACSYGAFPLEHQVDLLLATERTVPRDVPKFFATHNCENHTPTQLARRFDAQFTRLLGELDLSNTILYLVGDHGKLFGAHFTGSLEGLLDAANPLSYLVVPRGLLRDRPDMLANLQHNQQRLVSHFDMHRFFKEVPLLLAARSQPTPAFRQRTVQSLPRFTGGQHPYSVLTERVAANRTCIDAQIWQNTFCVCANITDVALTPDVRHDDTPLVKQIVSLVNRVTGNGSGACERLDAKHFRVQQHLRIGGETRGGSTSYAHNTRLLVAYWPPGMSDADVMTLKQQNSQMSFVVEFPNGGGGGGGGGGGANLLNVSNVERVDWYSKEPCIRSGLSDTNRVKEEVWIAGMKRPLPPSFHAPFCKCKAKSVRG